VAHLRLNTFCKRWTQKQGKALYFLAVQHHESWFESTPLQCAMAQALYATVPCASHVATIAALCVVEVEPPLLIRKQTARLRLA
jgi:hypothetical protein